MSRMPTLPSCWTCLAVPASSRQYAWRNMTSLEQLLGVFLGGAFGFVYDHAIDWWEDLASVPLSYPYRPATPFHRLWLAAGFGYPVGDAGQPATWSKLRRRDRDDPANLSRPALPTARCCTKPSTTKMLNSLLIRLLWAARAMAAAEVVRATREDVGPMMEHLSLPDEVTQLQRDAQMFDVLPPGLCRFGHLPADCRMHCRPLPRRRSRCWSGRSKQCSTRRSTASIRGSRVTVGVVWKLSSTRNTPCNSASTAGWTTPKPGTPGPTEGGLLHAPSPAQAFTSIVLRDKAINDPQTDRWQMDLTSSAIRTAARLADEVRLGQHFRTS